MNKILVRYLIYFGIFICLVQIMESTPLEGAFAKVGLKMDFESLGTYAPLFLSALLIDITYRIGKRQNEIAEQQTEIQKRQCEIEEFDVYKEMHRDVYKLHQYSRLVLPTIFGYFASNTAKDQAQRVEELEKVFDELSNKIAIDEADFVLRKGENKEINDAYNYVCFVAFLLGIVPAYVKDNRPEQSDLDKLNQLRIQNGNNSDQEWLKTLEPHLTNNAQLKATIYKFIEEKHLLFDSENNLLERIRKSYKNEIN